MPTVLAVILALGPMMAGHQVAASLPFVIPSLRVSGTVAFLFELPLNASVRALRLPDGRELVVAP